MAYLDTDFFADLEAIPPPPVTCQVTGLHGNSRRSYQALITLYDIKDMITNQLRDNYYPTPKTSSTQTPGFRCQLVTNFEVENLRFVPVWARLLLECWW